MGQEKPKEGRGVVFLYLSVSTEETGNLEVRLPRPGSSVPMWLAGGGN